MHAITGQETKSAHKCVSDPWPLSLPTKQPAFNQGTILVDIPIPNLYPKAPFPNTRDELYFYTFVGLFDTGSHSVAPSLGTCYVAGWP